MKNIQNKYLGSIMMARGRKKVLLLNDITYFIESKTKEPCGVMMIEGTEGILDIECKHYHGLTIFTIFTNKDGVIESVRCEMNDKLKDKLFGDTDIETMLNNNFVGSIVASSYTGKVELSNYDSSYYNGSVVDDNIARFIPPHDLYERTLSVFDN